MESQDVAIIVLAALVAVSEALALIPYFKDNSIIQFIIRVGKKFLPPKKDPMAVDMKKEDEAP